MSCPATMMRAAVGGELAGDQPQQRRLAGAARPHDGGDPAARDVEIEPVEDRPPAHGVAQIADLDDGRQFDSMNLLILRLRAASARSPWSATIYAAALSIEDLYSPAAAKPLSLARTNSAFCPLCERRRIAAPGAQRRLLQRASVAERERPRQRSRPHSSGSRCSVASVGLWPPDKKRDAGHRGRAHGASGCAGSPRATCSGRCLLRTLLARHHHIGLEHHALENDARGEQVVEDALAARHW